MSVLIKMPDGTASVTVNGVELSLVDGVVVADDTSTANLLIESFGGVMVENEPVEAVVAEEVVAAENQPRKKAKK